MSRALLRVRRGQAGGIVTAVRRPGGGRTGGKLVRRIAARPEGREGYMEARRAGCRKEDRKTGEAQAKRIAAQPKRGTKTG